MTASAKIIPFLPGIDGDPNTGALDGALYMLSRGYQVFRLAPGSKEPYSRGIHERTNDPEVVKRWHADNPHLNYGVALSADDVVVAPDLYQNGGPDDLKSLGEIPPTLTVNSARGGLHIYFKT